MTPAVGWRNCEHGWRRGCNDCYQDTQRQLLAVYAASAKSYAEVLMYDKDALLIAKTLEGSARQFFLEDDATIMKEIRNVRTT